MKTSIKANLDRIGLSDIYSLMLFVLYKVQDLPEYAVLSELCYLLDGSNLTRLLTYFAGKTITIPTEEDFVNLTNALLLYQYVNVDGMSLVDAQAKLKATAKNKEKALNLYIKILPAISEYNIDRTQVK